ncbi:MAG: hypothetical protein ACOYL6_05255 [Bacteriovoracaceae bacterium]
MLKLLTRDERGQGLIELLLFLPFLLMMYQITLSMGNAINGSINQQKFARGYHYARTKNNSMIPIPQLALQAGLTQYGLYFTGWAHKFDGGNHVPIAPCYPFRTMLKSENNESCDDGYSKTTTQLIRVQTAYGVCPVTFKKNAWGYEKDAMASYTDQACTNR